MSDLVRRLRTKRPYKSDVQIMVEMFGPEPPTVILGQGDYPTAVDIADRVTADMNAAADAIEALEARVAEFSCPVGMKDPLACSAGTCGDCLASRVLWLQTELLSARNAALEEAAKKICSMCEKCSGAGWLWGHELDCPPENVTQPDDTRYLCDGDWHKGEAAIRALKSEEKE